jgi:hypothetical protein
MVAPIVLPGAVRARQIPYRRDVTIRVKRDIEGLSVHPLAVIVSHNSVS